MRVAAWCVGHNVAQKQGNIQAVLPKRGMCELKARFMSRTCTLLKYMRT